jgi:hypothetical protein
MSNDIYIWFAENNGTERNGEQFIRAWTGDPERVESLRRAIGKKPTKYAIAPAADAQSDEGGVERLEAAIRGYATVVRMAQLPQHGGMQKELRQTRLRIHEVAKSVYAAPAENVAAHGYEIERRAIEACINRASCSTQSEFSAEQWAAIKHEVMQARAALHPAAPEKKAVAPLSLIPHLVARDEKAVSTALLEMSDAMGIWRAEAAKYRDVTSHDQSAFCDGYEAGMAAILSARAALVPTEATDAIAPTEGAISDDRARTLWSLARMISSTDWIKELRKSLAAPSPKPAVDALTTGAAEELAAPSDPKPLLGAVVAAKRAMHDRGIALAQFKDMFPKFVEAFDALNSGMPASEPTAYLYEHAQYPEDYTRVVSFERTDYSTGFACIPLYAHPAPSPKAPAPSVEQPLSDEQIEGYADNASCAYGNKIVDGTHETYGHWWTFDRDGLREFASKLQSAHTAGGRHE